MLGLIGIYYHLPRRRAPHLNILEIAQNDAISHARQTFLFPMTFVGFPCVLGAMFPSTLVA